MIFSDMDVRISSLEFNLEQKQRVINKYTHVKSYPDQPLSSVLLRVHTDDEYKNLKL